VLPIKNIGKKICSFNLSLNYSDPFEWVMSLKRSGFGKMAKVLFAFVRMEGPIGKSFLKIALERGPRACPERYAYESASSVLMG
jgi:hypothetical protein